MPLDVKIRKLEENGWSKKDAPPILEGKVYTYNVRQDGIAHTLLEARLFERGVRITHNREFPLVISKKNDGQEFYLQLYTQHVLVAGTHTVDIDTAEVYAPEKQGNTQSLEKLATHLSVRLADKLIKRSFASPAAGNYGAVRASDLGLTDNRGVVVATGETTVYIGFTVHEQDGMYSLMPGAGPHAHNAALRFDYASYRPLPRPNKLRKQAPKVRRKYTTGGQTG
jgi:hypothetical protein